MTTTTVTTRRSQPPRSNPVRRQRAKKPAANRQQRRGTRRQQQTVVSRTSKTYPLRSEQSLIRQLNRNQNAFITDVSQYAPRRQSDRAMFMQYMKTLVNNEKTESRFPDSEPRATSLFTSVSSFTVPLTPDDPTSSTYRFAFAIQPIMGDISDPTHYQAAVVSLPTGQNYDTADFSSAASYLTNSGTRDPRVDINYNFLAAASGSGTALTTTFNATGAALAQPAINIFPPPSQNYIGSSIPNTTGTTVNTSLGSLRLIQNTDGSLTFPPGSFKITAKSRLTAGGAALTQVVPSIVWDTTTGSVIIAANASVNNSDLAAGATGNVSSDVNLIITRPTKLYFTILKNFTTVPIPLAAGDLTGMINTVTVTSTQFALPGPNTGAIQVIRPVAQTVLVTYIGPELTDGGRIVSHYLPRSALYSNFFTSSPGNAQGQYQKCENLATVKNAYDGKLHDGTFVWWCPYDRSDSEFQSIATMNANQWPSIVVAGLFNPAGSTINANSLSNIVRVRLLTTFEFITESTAFDDQVQAGSSEILDSVNQALANQPHAMPNGLHLDWIGSMLKNAGAWAMKHPDTILKGIAAGAALL